MLAEAWYIDATKISSHCHCRPGRLPLLVLEGQWGEARAVASTIVAVVGMVHSWTMPEANSVCSPVCKASPRSRGAW